MANYAHAFSIHFCTQIVQWQFQYYAVKCTWAPWLKVLRGVPENDLFLPTSAEHQWYMYLYLNCIHTIQMISDVISKSFLTSSKVSYHKQIYLGHSLCVNQLIFIRNFTSNKVQGPPLLNIVAWPIHFVWLWNCRVVLDTALKYLLFLITTHMYLVKIMTIL